MRAAILALSLLGCAEAGPLADARPLGQVSFDDEGRTAPLRAGPGEGAVWAVGAPDTCFRLEENARGASLDLVEGDELVVYQRVRCATGTPLREPLPAALDVFWLPARPRGGALSLRFLVSEHSGLRGHPERAEALVEDLTAELAGTGVVPRLVDVVSIRAPRESRYADLEPEALDAMLAQAPRASGTVDVVFAGCLRRVDATGTVGAVEGVTGRVGGGGGGAADAVFLSGLRCDAFGDATRPVDAALARLLAHELGHFLGLAHVDDPTNRMHPHPGLASARELTTAQRRRLRRHPFL